MGVSSSPFLSGIPGLWKSADKAINKPMPTPPPIPKAPPAATPATLAQAASATKTAKRPGAYGDGTFGSSGPQGLTTPPQTANLTLLGGTK